MSLLINLQAILQRHVRNLWDRVVDGRIDLDAAFEELVNSAFGADVGTELFEFLQRRLHRSGRIDGFSGMSSQTNWHYLEALGSLRRKKVVHNHEVQYLISPARRFLKVFHSGSVFARRLCDASQQRRLVSVLHRERLNGLMKVIIGGCREAVAAIPQIYKARITREELFLGPASRSVLLTHLSLDPQGETDCLYFQQKLVCARYTNDKGQGVRKDALMLK